MKKILVLLLCAVMLVPVSAQGEQYADALFEEEVYSLVHDTTAGVFCDWMQGCHIYKPRENGNENEEDTYAELRWYMPVAFTTFQDDSGEFFRMLRDEGNFKGESDYFYIYVPENNPESRICFVTEHYLLDKMEDWEDGDTPESYYSRDTEHVTNMRKVLINGVVVPCYDYYFRGLDEPFYFTNYCWPFPGGFEKFSACNFAIDSSTHEYQVHEDQGYYACVRNLLCTVGDNKNPYEPDLITQTEFNWESVREEAEAAGGAFEQIGDCPYKIWVPDGMKREEMSPEYAGWCAGQYGFVSQYASDMAAKLYIQYVDISGFSDAYWQNEDPARRTISINGLEGYSENQDNIIMFVYQQRAKDQVIRLYCDLGYRDDSGSYWTIRDPIYYDYIKWMVSSIQPIE